VKLLIVGRSGQVARALLDRAPSHGLEVQAFGRPQLDLLRPNTIAPLFAAARPDVVINVAAFTTVDKAETQRDAAFAVNAAGAEAVAAAASAAGAPVIHASTDYVFSGDKQSPYVEYDATAPASVYGATKLEGERRVLAANPRAVIVRTAWMYDSQGSNFVRTMLRLARARREVSIVEDQVGCPTYAADFADGLLAIAGRKADPVGIYHCAGAGETSWAGFAEEVFAASRDRGGPSARVIPISSHEYPTPAPRPANSRLNCSKLAIDYGVRLRPWRSALADCMDAIAASGWSVE
jgi:dTDP-4-dehydrorhamnose reductase